MDYELIWWYVMSGLAILFMISTHLPWNDGYNRNDDDPYRYCPKEEE